MGRALLAGNVRQRCHGQKGLRVCLSCQMVQIRELQG